MEDKKILSVREAARYANVTETTIRNWAGSFDIGFKSAGRWKIKRLELDKVINGEYHYSFKYKKKKRKKHVKK